jgi:head-tail adaptor
MAIGNLKPIKLIEYTEVIDAFGDAVESITNTYKMWADVTDQGGTRGQELGRTAMSDSKEFRINFRGYLVTANYKIEYFGQTYAITNVQRVQEKRFNYILTGFATFEANAGGGSTSVVNPTSFDYNQETGVFTFNGGNLNGNLLQIIVRQPNGQPYTNNFNERVSLGGSPETQIYYPYLTPPDEVEVFWYVYQPLPPFTQLTDEASAPLTCERLCIRKFRIYNYAVQNEVLSYTTIDGGVNVYNCEGTYIGYAVGIEEYINLQNADPVNSQYFGISNYELEQSNVYGANYLLTCSPVDPYQQWNPANTKLYLQAD